VKTGSEAESAAAARRLGPHRPKLALRPGGGFRGIDPEPDLSRLLIVRCDVEADRIAQALDKLIERLSGGRALGPLGELCPERIVLVVDINMQRTLVHLDHLR
jgi:hypothetical protein